MEVAESEVPEKSARSENRVRKRWTLRGTEKTKHVVHDVDAETSD